MTQIKTITLEKNVFDLEPVARSIRIVSVQLDSPFNAGLEISADKTLLSWDSRKREQERVDRVDAILASLVGPNERSSLDIVSFPEYSVPETAHNRPHFQNFADQHRCIVAPGTYYVNAPGNPLHRNNVAKIYIPQHAEPVTLAKQHPTPLEAHLIEPNHDYSNILQMLWRPPGRETVSFNIFICRDYLLPFTKGDPSADVALWSYEGINFVLMHNSEERLFEGQAALEVRRLRGPGRVVIFANNANLDNNANKGSTLGTAILGPSSQLEKNDIVRSIPCDREGMLVAQVRPWDIHYWVMKPDKVQDFPIADSKVYSFTPDEEAGEVLLKPEDEFPEARAVWHPAFLEEIGRVIVIELLVAKRLAHTIAELPSRAKNVHVGVIRGVQDILVRRYAYQWDAEASGMIPNLASDFTGLKKNDVDEFFEERDRLRLMIYPSGIYKYRGMNTQRQSAQIRNAIARDLAKSGKPHDLKSFDRKISEICQAAISSSKELGIAPALKCYFLSELETNIPIGYQYSNGIRETYVLIAVQIHQDHIRSLFYEKVIGQILMENSHVKEIFKIGQAESDGVRFDYMVKIKAKPYDTDKIIASLRGWKEDADAKIFTRSFDVTDVLLRTSIQGISDFDISEKMSGFRRLLYDDTGHNAGSGNMLDLAYKERFAEVANEWHSAHQTAITLNSDKTALICSEIFLAIYLFYISPDSERAQKAKRVSAAIHELYVTIEDSAEPALLNYLGCNKASIGRVASQHYPDVEKNNNWEQNKGDPLKVLIVHGSAVFPQIGNDADLKENLRACREALNRVLPMRNSFAHGGNSGSKSIFDLRDPDWRNKFQAISRYVTDILQIDRYITEVAAKMDDAVSPEKV